MVSYRIRVLDLLDSRRPHVWGVLWLLALDVLLLAHILYLLRGV